MLCSGLFLFAVHLDSAFAPLTLEKVFSSWTLPVMTLLAGINPLLRLKAIPFLPDTPIKRPFSTQEIPPRRLVTIIPYFVPAGFFFYRSTIECARRDHLCSRLWHLLCWHHLFFASQWRVLQKDHHEKKNKEKRNNTMTPRKRPRDPKRPLSNHF